MSLSLYQLVQAWLEQPSSMFRQDASTKPHVRLLNEYISFQVYAHAYTYVRIYTEHFTFA